MSIENQVQDIANQCLAVIGDRIKAAKEAEGILAQLEVHALTGAAEGVSFLLNSLKESFKNGKSDTLDVQVAPSTEASAPAEAGAASSSPATVPADPAGG